MVANNTGGVDNAERRGEILAAARRWMAGEGGGRLPKTRDIIAGVNETTVRRHFGSWKAFVEELSRGISRRIEGSGTAESFSGVFSTPDVQKTPKNGRFGEWGAANDAGEPSSSSSKVRAIREMLKERQVRADDESRGRDRGVSGGFRGSTNINSKLTMVIPDIHFPHHDEVALEVVRKAIRDLRPREVVFLGDVLDCEVFSFHDKGTVAEARMYDYRESEIMPARELLDWCGEYAGNTVFVAGNHEHRAERWAVRSGIGGMAVYDIISPKRLLSEGRSASSFKWIDYVPSEEPIAHHRVTTSGSLIAVHGWSFSVHAAAVHLARSRSRSVVFGHIHRSQSVVSRDPFTGRVLHAWSPGCLTKLQPIYGLGGLPTDWIHGFSLVYCASDGVGFSPYTCVIEKGETVLPSGEMVRA